MHTQYQSRQKVMNLCRIAVDSQVVSSEPNWFVSALVRLDDSATNEAAWLSLSYDGANLCVPVSASNPPGSTQIGIAQGGM